ncbi:MAG: COX15/CtaA family protein [Phycisphaerales bacterium JB038]
MSSQLDSVGAVDLASDTKTTVESQSRGSAVLAVAFGTTVAMWFVGYVGRLPLIMAPSWLVGIAIILCLLAGGIVATRYRALGARGLLCAGVVSATLNLLILGSVLADSKEAMRAAMLWLPGFYILSVILLQVGGLIGRSFVSDRAPVNWTACFALTAVIATGLLLTAGGLVTGADAGLSVPDWPGTFGNNMFLYPLSRMTGAIYYEHAHRLYGALVGFTTIVLAIHLWRTDRRRWLKWLAVGAIIAVVAQGIMGGVRVTAAETGADGIAVSQAEHETSLSLLLRIVHGVFGQVFFALMTFIAVATTRSWRSLQAPQPHPSAVTERQLSLALVGAIILQLILGTIARHTSDMVWILLHVTFAAGLGCLAYLSAIRLWTLYGKEQAMLRKLGLALILLVSLQLLLGLAAFVVVLLVAEGEPPSIWNVTITTMHQATGACILAAATAIAAIVLQQLKPSEEAEAIKAQAEVA